MKPGSLIAANPEGNTQPLKAPVILFVFNRLQSTRLVFEAIAAARPTTLLVIADAPRVDRKGDQQACAEVLKLFSSIDWPCNFLMNQAKENMGCDQRIVSGLDWAFSIVKEAIILEDDCLPDPSFFRFCEELLSRYRDDRRFAGISGTNYVPSSGSAGKDSYTFSLLASYWGWATWRDRWQHFDRHLASWPSLRNTAALSHLFDEPRAATFWKTLFDAARRDGQHSPWDYRWTYTNLVRHRLTIVPKHNMIQNLGFGAGATHTTDADRRLIAKKESTPFPLTHPAGVIWSRRYDDLFLKLNYETLGRRAERKVNQLCSLLSKLAVTLCRRGSMTDTHASPSWRRRLKLGTWFVPDLLASLVPARRQSSRVLVVRLDNIGDFILWLDTAQRLVAYYRSRGKQVSLVASSSWAPWVQELAMFDRVLSLDRERFEKAPLYRLQTQLHIRRWGCSIALAPGYSRSWSAGDAIIHSCGAAQRIGSEGDPTSGSRLERRLANRWYTKLIPASTAKMMELERNVEFLSGVVGQEIPIHAPDLRALLSQHHISKTVAALNLERPFYVLFPGASAAGKRWPIAHFRVVAKRIYEQTGWLGVVCGGPGDMLLAEELRSDNSVPLISYAGSTSLSQLASILSEAEFVLSNDTSAVHIAAALAVPAVCILGGGHAIRFLPYVVNKPERTALPISVSYPMDCFDCNWNCIYKVASDAPKPCIANVTVDSVWRQVSAVLSRQSLPLSRTAH